MSESLMRLAKLLKELPAYREGNHARIMEEQRETNPYAIFVRTPLIAQVWYAGWDDADEDLKKMSEAEDKFPTHPFVEGNDN